jgi:L-lactate dehydrogenase
MNDRSVPLRYPCAALVELANTLLVRIGMRADIAHDVADILVIGDLMGHTTHGLAQLPGYLTELDTGAMAKSGAPSIVTARPAAQTWDGGRLPGPWLTLRALDVASVMAREYGTGTVAIRRSHHIAALAAYLPRVTGTGLMAIIACSDPSGASVAPFGGLTPVFTPNPIAAGIPTAGDPILLDVSASYTTNGLTGRLYKSGEKLEHAWIQDAEGRATNDPAVLYNEPKGTLLPLGGLEAGHKGFALALLIEAMTGGLTGFGRADPNEGWGASVFVQLLDPNAFGGRDAFVRQTQWLADACHASAPREGVERVRLPGERALARMREQRDNGVELHPTILPALAPWARKLGVAMPAAR